MTPDQIASLKLQLSTKNAEMETFLNTPGANADTLRQAKALDVDIKKLEADIASAENDAREFAELRTKAAARTAHLNKPAPGAPFQVKAFEDAGSTTFVRNEKGEPTVLDESGAGAFGQKRWEEMGSLEYRKEFRAYIRKGARYLDGSKALLAGQDEQGGVFAPADMIQRIIGREAAPTQLRSLVQTQTTGRDTVELPRQQYSADDKYTTAFRAQFTGETPADGTGASHAIDDTKIFGSIMIPIHTAMLSAALSKNLIEDAAFPIQAWIESKLNEAIDLLYEDMILNGTGIGQPLGILFGAAAGNDGTDAVKPEVVLSGAAGALSYDGLDSLQAALASQYENENTRWIMNKKSTLSAIRKIKDVNNRPLFTTGSQDYGMVGARGRILFGDPIVLSAFMPNVGAANFPIIYGDLKGYMLAQRLGFSIQTLHETRAKVNQVELVGRVRFGGKTVEPFRLKIGKSNNA